MRVKEYKTKENHRWVHWEERDIFCHAHSSRFVIVSQGLYRSDTGRAELSIHLAAKHTTDGAGCLRGSGTVTSGSECPGAFKKCMSDLKPWPCPFSILHFLPGCNYPQPHSPKRNIVLICRYTGQMSVCAQDHKSFIKPFLFLSLSLRFVEHFVYN